jgi:mycothiol synthase
VSSDGVSIFSLDRLDPSTVAEVVALVDAVTEADGVRPLSEHVMLHLRYGGDDADRNVLLRDADGTLAAYAHLDASDTVEGASAELAVHPAHRGAGHGRRIVSALVDATSDGRLRLWAHGKGSGAAELARSMGFTQMRELWQMRRSLFARLPEPHVPDGIVVRAFRPGADDDAWVALNARAFASHPEQGAWTVRDLRQRMAEPWFDPAGFFVAERDGKLLGFHWTKVHGGGAANGHGGGAANGHGEVDHGHEPIGEVYVVGVDPDAHGSGLGKALTLVGLAHLRAAGLAQVMLYVDADNTAAVRLYTGLGFTHWDTDAMFRR